jgi:flagellar biosynthesis component FlhA
MSARLGTFFIVIGAALFMLFIFSDMADTPTCSLLFAALVLLIAGYLLIKRDWAPPSPSKRFAWLNQQRTARKAKKQKMAEQNKNKL